MGLTRAAHAMRRVRPTKVSGPALVPVAVALFGCVAYGLYALETGGAAARPWERDAIPFTERDALAGCARRGLAVAACLDSEAALRPRAQALWATASPALRRACLRETGTAEQAGKLYACLALNAPPDR